MTGRDLRVEALGHQGTPIECTAAEYRNGLRNTMLARAADWLDKGQDIRAQLVLTEVARLDKTHGERI